MFGDHFGKSDWLQSDILFADRKDRVVQSFGHSVVEKICEVLVIAVTVRIALLDSEDGEIVVHRVRVVV